MTETLNFRASTGESHDASKFYERFRALELSDDETVLTLVELDNPFFVFDA